MRLKLALTIITLSLGSIASASLDSNSPENNTRSVKDPAVASIVDHCGKRLQGLLDARASQGRSFPATASGDSYADTRQALRLKVTYLKMCFEAELGQISQEDQLEVIQAIQGG